MGRSDVLQGLHGDLGGASGFIQPVPHVPSLSFCRNALTRHDAILSRDDSVLLTRDTDLKANRSKLQAQQNKRSDAEPLGPPLGRRLAIFLGLFFGGFLVSLRGWLDLDNKRRSTSAAWIVGGLLLSASGLGLWWATIALPSTWGWWL